MKYMTRLVIAGSLRLVMTTLLCVMLAGLAYLLLAALIMYFPAHALR